MVPHTASSGGSDVWLVLLGAALSLFAALLVQWIVVPRVVRRRRARERWEDDVLRLADLVAVDLARRREQAFEAWADYWGYWDAFERLKKKGPIKTEMANDVLTEKRDAGDAALDRFEQVAHEVRWLAKRVYGRGRDQLSLLEMRAVIYAGAIPVAPFSETLTASPEGRERCHSEWDKEETQRSELLESVLALSDLVLIVPPHRTRARVKRAIHLLRALLRRPGRRVQSDGSPDRPSSSGH